jgi:hypothetical protein
MSDWGNSLALSARIIALPGTGVQQRFEPQMAASARLSVRLATVALLLAASVAALSAHQV